MQTLGVGFTWEQLSPGQKFRTLNRTVTETDLDFAGQCDDELAARRVVPVGEVAGLRRPEDDALGRLHGRQLRVRGEI